jgi:hypothetical protein
MSSLQSHERAQANEAVEVFSKLEGEIRQLVSRDTRAPRLQEGNDSESAATNIGSMLQHVSGTSVQEVEKLIAELQIFEKRCRRRQRACNVRSWDTQSSYKTPGDRRGPFPDSVSFLKNDRDDTTRISA